MDGFLGEEICEIRTEKKSLRERVQERMWYVEGKARAKALRCV